MVRTFLSLLPSFCSGAQPLRPSFSTSLPDLVLLICPVRVPSLTSQLLSLSAVCCFPKPATEDLCFQKRQNLLPYLLSCPDQSRLLQGTPRFSFFGKILCFFFPQQSMARLLTVQSSSLSVWCQVCTHLQGYQSKNQP